MVEIRPAHSEDADALAALHVAAWGETYLGLLPASEIAAHGIEMRQAQWRRSLAHGAARVMLAPDAGFAQIGPQRDAALARQGYEEELYAIYVLRAYWGRGVGLALLRATLGAAPDAFTALVIDGNQRACAFYGRTGGQILEIRGEMVGDVPIQERVYGWDAAAALSLVRPDA